MPDIGSRYYYSDRGSGGVVLLVTTCRQAVAVLDFAGLCAEGGITGGCGGMAPRGVGVWPPGEWGALPRKIFLN